MSQLTRSFTLCSDVVELLACIQSNSGRWSVRDVESAWKKWRTLSGQTAAGAYNEALLQPAGTDVALSSASVPREDALRTTLKIEQPWLNHPYNDPLLNLPDRPVLGIRPRDRQRPSLVENSQLSILNQAGVQLELVRIVTKLNLKGWMVARLVVHLANHGAQARLPFVS